MAVVTPVHQSQVCQERGCRVIFWPDEHHYCVRHPAYMMNSLFDTEVCVVSVDALLVAWGPGLDHNPHAVTSLVVAARSHVKAWSAA